MKYDQLCEKALANFELLLNAWGIDYKYLGKGEYDFITPTRKDQHFGACRFNTEKGRGADFSGISNVFTDTDYGLFGKGFDRSDFMGFSNGQSHKAGFDIIGLCQRICNKDSYNDGARVLQDYIQSLETDEAYVKVARNAAKLRREKLELQNKKVIEHAKDLWRACENISLKGSAAEIYLNNRGISLPSEPNIRFHPTVKHSETKTYLPCILFKVQVAPDGPAVALHRIYLRKDGSGKADVSNPKMALAKIAGAGIWFGRPGCILVIVEGPENALTAVYTYKCPFVVCTISANNFSALTIPSYVEELILIPDEDNAGEANCAKAIQNYYKQNKKLKMTLRKVDWEAEWLKKET